MFWHLLIPEWRLSDRISFHFPNPYFASFSIYPLSHAITVWLEAHSASFRLALSLLSHRKLPIFIRLLDCSWFIVSWPELQFVILFFYFIIIFYSFYLADRLCLYFCLPSKITLVWTTCGVFDLVFGIRGSLALTASMTDCVAAVRLALCEFSFNFVDYHLMTFKIWVFKLQ